PRWRTRPSGRSTSGTARSRERSLPYDQKDRKAVPASHRQPQNALFLHHAGHYHRRDGGGHPGVHHPERRHRHHQQHLRHGLPAHHRLGHQRRGVPLPGVGGVPGGHRRHRDRSAHHHLQRDR